MTATTQAHWAEKYRAAATGTEGYWMFRIACYTTGFSEAQVRDIAEICLRLNCGVWHAVYVYGGSVGKCPCAVC